MPEETGMCHYLGAVFPCYIVWYILWVMHDDTKYFMSYMLVRILVSQWAKVSIWWWCVEFDPCPRKPGELLCEFGFMYL